jgi:hypothetical protein
MRRWTGVIAVVAALAAATPASAQAPPIPLGPGEDASMVTDGVGLTHVVFESGGDYVYCRLPRRARGCDIRTTLVMPGVGQPPRIRLRPDGAIFVVGAIDETDEDRTYRGATYLFASSDRGLTWSGPSRIAVNNYAFSAVSLSNDGRSAFTLAYGRSVLDLQVAPFTGGETRVINLLYGDNPPNYADMDVLPDGRIMVIFGDLEDVRWRLFGGGDVYDANAWGAQGVIRAIDGAELVSGPRGTYLFEHRSLRAQRTGSFWAPFGFSSLDTRRLRWRTARAAAADRSIFGSSTAIQDARGRIHVVADTGGAGLTTCVLYARTGPKGSRRQPWFGKTTILFRTIRDELEPTNVRVAAGPNGRGYAVWEDKTGTIWFTPLRQARGKYRPRANQNDRPACVGRRYS